LASARSGLDQSTASGRRIQTSYVDDGCLRSSRSVIFPGNHRDGPDDQWAVDGFHIDPPVGEPALTAPLPAGSQAMGERQTRLPAVETDGLAQQQPSHHPGEENQMTLVTDRTVLTQKADQLSMQLGKGCHGDLVWSDSPTLSWLPAHPIS